MALQTSGQITLDDIHVEAGGTTGTLCSINDTDILALLTSATAPHNFSEWYGASSGPPPVNYIVSSDWDAVSNPSWSHTEIPIISGYASIRLTVNRAGTYTVVGNGSSTKASGDWHTSKTSTVGDDYYCYYYGGSPLSSYFPDGCWYSTNASDTSCDLSYTSNNLSTSRYFEIRSTTWGGTTCTTTYEIKPLFYIRDSAHDFSGYGTRITMTANWCDPT